MSKKRSLTAATSSGDRTVKHLHLTLHDKITILDYMQKNSHLGQREVATHFKKKGFPGINQSSISRFKTNETKLREEAKNTANLSFKRARLVEHPEVEAALWAWTLQVQSRGLKLTGDILREKARRFARIQGLEDEQFLSLSNGWLQKFKDRHALKQYRFHGEAGSVNEDNVQLEITRLRKITDKYQEKDILNMDESGLNDRMPPDRGLATAQFSGQKADKHRITYAFTANADGSEKLPPLIIGHARKPRAFKKKEGKDLGFDYWWNKKAWMTASIFQGLVLSLLFRLK